MAARPLAGAVNGDPIAGPPERAALIRSTSMLRDALAGLDASQLDRRRGAGEWSAWDIAYHITQIEIWYLAKLCEASSTDRSEALDRFVEAWRSVREASLALAGELPAERLDRPGLLGGVPDWTARDLLERMAAHDIEHAQQAAAASGRGRQRAAGNGQSGDGATVQG